MYNSSISAKIVADSIDNNGKRLTTYLLKYPRFILSELNTHRMFSRNSASSRAIPLAKVIEQVENDPVIPIAWQKKHKGMQGYEYFTDAAHIEKRKEAWINASQSAVHHARVLGIAQDVTKQLVNRLLEPFQWMTTLVTATEFENFLELRCPKYYDKCDGSYKRSRSDINSANEHGEYPKYFYNDLEWLELSESGAEIHIQRLAEAMWDARNESEPKILYAGEWHIPFGDNMDSEVLMNIFYANNKRKDGVDLKDHVKNLVSYEDIMIKIAVARCARLSYNTHDGEIDYEKDIALYEQLRESRHASPFEHVAQCTEENKFFANFDGWQSVRNQLGI